MNDDAPLARLLADLKEEAGKMDKLSGGFQVTAIFLRRAADLIQSQARELEQRPELK